MFSINYLEVFQDCDALLRKNLTIGKFWFNDKFVELSILPVFIRTFELFYKEYKDERVEKILNSLKYGSNDEIIILLKRYGFIKEEIDIIKDYVLSASEDEIVFRNDCLAFIEDELLRKKVERYMN